MGGKEWLAKIIDTSGGVIEEGLFVVQPGIRILQESRLAPGAIEILGSLNIPSKRQEYEQVAELNSRLTYLSFRDEPDLDGKYLKRVAAEAQHLSVFATTYVTFIIAGISLECSMELIAHKEARVARLTSSRTIAMNDTLYSVRGTERERAWQKQTIARFLPTRQEQDGVSLEITNQANLGSKATALTYTMNLKDFHSLFIGRLPLGGNEEEVREVCGRMCDQLHDKYPLVILPVRYYEAMSNGRKYEL